jgi:endoglucanase
MKKRNLKQRINSCLFITSLLFSSLFLNAQNYCSSSPVAVHGSLSVSGNKIVDQNNNPVSFAGNSYFWSNSGWGAEKYYNADVVNWLATDWNTTIVRAAMGVEDSGGYMSNPTENKNRVKAVVDAAIAKGIYVIIDWHSHHAEDNQAAAISFFQEMAQTYGNNPHVIYEIYNEPLQVSWSNTIKPYAEAVIAAIRAIDPDNLIIVGTSTWSQDVDIASNDPITSASNIAYTLHFYAATHKESLRQKAQTALNNGIALMVTEWGSVEASGGGNVDAASTDAWMAFLAANDITHANWSIHDKSEGASVLQLGASASGSWAANDLTASGTKVKSIVKNWKQYCSGGGTINEPPTVAITSPSVNSTATEGTPVEVNVTAGDVDGTVTKVAFYANGSLLGTDTSSPYTQSWNPTSGSYTLTAIATDDSGATKTSAGVAVTVSTLPGGGGTCDNLPVWNSATVYSVSGTEVVFNGNIYKNNWYSQNQSPATNAGQWLVWTLVASCTFGDLTANKTDFNESDALKIFPNPTSDILQVDIANTEDFTSVSIIDFQGRLVYEKKITSKGMIEISLDNYKEGMYFVKLSGKKEVTKSFLKKR